MLIVLRIVFGAALVYGIMQASENAEKNLEAGDLTNAFWTGYCVLVAILNAAVWAPFIGDKISQPITGMITRSTYFEQKNYLLKLIHWLENRGYRRLVVFLCFLEGIRRPGQPTAFVVGLKNAKPGSWLEKVYAREVFKFGNAQNCLAAYEILLRHRVDPGAHPNPEVNLLLMSHYRAPKSDPDKIAVPPAAPPPVTRDPRIRLFDSADSPGEPKEHLTEVSGQDRSSPS
jgi:hypothetical protein